MTTPTILVIEDNAVTRNVVHLTLTNEGFDVVDTSGADEALAVAARSSPDLVLQDLILPDMDGFDLVVRLRALPGMEAVPIIAFSGLLSRLEYGRAAALGFTDFLPKPVEPSRLVQVVRTHLPAMGMAEPTGLRRRVLLVDDDPIQLKIGRLRLRALGFEVVTAIDGVKALEIVRSSPIDAVLSDVLMPRMDGFRLCAEIRRDPALERVPVILASSSYVEDSDRALGERMGASDFVLRTPDLEAVVAALTAVLAAPRDVAPPQLEVPPVEHYDRVVRQLQRQAAMNVEFAHRSSMHASMLSVVVQMSEAVTHHRSVEDSLPDILAKLLEATGIPCGALFVSTAGKADLALAATLGFGASVAADLGAFCGHRDAFDRVVTAMKPSAVAPTDDDVAASDLLDRIEVGYALLIPLVSGGDCLGVLLLGSPDRDLIDRDGFAVAHMISVQIGQGLALSRAFRRLAASEKYGRMLLDRATECIVMLDLDGTIKDVNPEGERFLGRSAAELTGRSLLELIAADRRAQAKRDIAALVETGRVAVEGMRFVRAGGATVIADMSATVVEADGEQQIMSIWRDVTAKHAADTELRIVRDVTLAATRAPDVSALFDVVLSTLGKTGDWTFGAAWRPRSQSGTLTCEHVWTRSLDDRERLAPIAASTFAPNEGVLGRAWATRRAHWTRDLAHEVDCPRSAAASTLGLHAGLVVPIITGGEVVAVIELFKDAQGEDEGFVKLASTLALELASVIERKRSEDALRASEARFARLWDSGIVGIAIADTLGNTHDANDAYLGMIGYSRADLLAGQIPSAEQTPVQWQAADAAALAELQAEGRARPWEKELVRKDGTCVPVLIGAAMLDPLNCIAFVSDLTERKRAEASLHRSDEQLRQAQKMEAVGRLAGGIAHDFNNALSVVLSYGEMILDDLRPGDPMRESVDEICKAGLRAAGLTRQLLMFSRQQVVEPRVLDLNEILLDVDKMLQRILGADIELISLRTEPLGMVRADPGSIEQVILNLVVNARDAMPTGGKLTLETSNVVLDDDYVRAHHGALPGPHVRLSVTDTGVGMDRLTQTRIFEPFFTTKERGKGTGLGLSTVFGIVQQSGGSIWVYSEPGIGTTFKIHLPRTDADADDTDRNCPLPVIRARGSETILLVEDEDQVRVVARDILRRNGYKVLEARNAGEAILLSETSGAISLLLTDVVMPQMSGPLLAKRMAGHFPGIRILCMSGYTDDSVVRHGVLDATMAYLQKPFTPETLTRKVREVLDAAPM